jgi:hypothetical protein
MTSTQTTSRYAPKPVLEIAEQTVPRQQVLDAILAGGRTKQQLANRLGIDIAPVGDYRDQAELDRLAPARALTIVLNSLCCAGLLNMRPINGQWHYLPTATVTPGGEGGNYRQLEGRASNEAVIAR